MEEDIELKVKRICQEEHDKFEPIFQKEVITVEDAVQILESNVYIPDQKLKQIVQFVINRLQIEMSTITKETNQLYQPYGLVYVIKFLEKVDYLPYRIRDLLAEYLNDQIYTSCLVAGIIEEHEKVPNPEDVVYC